MAGYNAGLLESHRDFHDMVVRLRENIDRHQLSPFLNRFNFNPDPERCWRQVEEIFAVNNPRLCAEFARQFCADHDPRTAGLKRIKCPNLVLVGEHDIYQRKPSEQIARCAVRGTERILPSNLRTYHRE